MPPGWPVFRAIIEFVYLFVFFFAVLVVVVIVSVFFFLSCFAFVVRKQYGQIHRCNCVICFLAAKISLNDNSTSFATSYF